MKFKITKLHLFLILLTVLIFSSLGIKVLEGMNIIEGNTNLEDSSEAAPDPDDLIADPAAGGEEESGGMDANGNSAEDGDDYNPFGNTTNGEGEEMEEGDVTGNYNPDDTTFQTDLNVTFNTSNPSKTRSSYGAKNGIPKSQIPPGEEHLYVLKSQVVPPVCPKCPEIKRGGGGGGGGKGMKGGQCCPECPPCPRPQRCPEPAFTCKKVPNYSAANVDSVLPGGGEGGGMMGGGSGGLLGGGGGGGGGGLLNGTGAGAGNGSAIPVLNSFASFS